MKIEIKNLSKKFKNIEVLRDVNLTFESGKIYGLYGRNGSGKSVLLKMLCGFYSSTSGEILYNGENLEKLDLSKLDIRAMIENPSFFPDVSGFENLMMLANIQKKIGCNEVIKALETVNLLDDRNKRYGKYSLGMKQKLGFACVIMEDAKVIILDEPFNGIEKVTCDKLMNYLKELKKQDKIIILSTHIREDLEHLSDEIYLFEDGTIKKHSGV